MLQWFSDVVKAEAVGRFVIEHSLFWPMCEFLHFVGLALLVGVVGLLDLRLLGVAKAVPIAALHRMLPWGILGFGLCVATGYVFVAGDSFQDPIVYFTNLSFQLKMLCVALAGLNAVLFYVTGLGRRIEQLGAGASAPLGAKVIAGSSLVLWIAVIYFGRMIPWADGLWLVLVGPEELGAGR